ncbi:hypothetical protein G6038_06280 [Rhodococcus sp. 14C212]|uniref:cell division protein PerM n=1 Tax=Rhodococcus sp. 14C212 TaxID=2711209 RepID=UPI0013ED75C8|nr:DUF6350 family protein [Rhodococcus sp. 14C212]NGP05099.1 hypothetical protein [Rhodococcus sp. 14C212]
MTSTLGRSDRHTTPEGNPVEPEQLRILLGTAAKVPVVTLALIATLVVTTMVAASSDLTGIYAAIAGSWLALHQVTLTIDGVSLGVLPLLPTAVLVWLTARAAGSATEGFVALGGRPLDRRNASRIAVATLAGPTVITVVALIVIQDAASVLPVVTPNPAAALAWVTALYLLGAGLGIGARTWRPLSVRYGVPNWLVAAVCPAARTVLGMFASAGVVTVLGLLWSWTVVGDLIGRGGGVTGALGLTVLSVLYLPNVLIGAAAVVAGSTVQFGDVTLSLFEATGGDLPALPVLAVIPPGPAAPFWPVLLAVPATVGALLGRYVAQRHLEARARGEYASSTDAALTVVAAAALAGATTALATWVAGGPLGVFGVVGGNWWLAGVLVFAWTGLLGLVTSQLLLWREHRLAAADAARASAAEENAAAENAAAENAAAENAAAENAAAENAAAENAAAENPDDGEPVEEADAAPLGEVKVLEAGPATPAADVLDAEIVEDGREGGQDAAGDADVADDADADDAGAPAVADTEVEDAAGEPGEAEQDAGAPPARNRDLPDGAAPPKG